MNKISYVEMKPKTKNQEPKTKSKPYYRCFETLGNELRIEIIKALNEKEMCVTELSKELAVERSRASHSLALLKRCCLINSRKEGKRQIYFLDPRLKQLLKNETVLIALSSCMDKCKPVCRGRK